MKRWRIQYNDLPSDVLNAVLCVDKLSGDPSQWRLLRSGNTRRVYHFTPEGSSASWVVKWGRLHTFSQSRRALFGKTEAEIEADAARLAIENGIPSPRPRLVAMAWRPLLHTVLVTEFIPEAKDLASFFREKCCCSGENEIQSLLTGLATLLSDMHMKKLLHFDFSATNVLIDGGGNFNVVDVFKLKRVENVVGPFNQDLHRIVVDLFKTPIGVAMIRRFVDDYARMTNLTEDNRAGFFERIQSNAIKSLNRLARRAANNCIRRARALERYRYGKYLVFMVKNAGRDRIEHAIDHACGKTEKRNGLTVNCEKRKPWPGRGSSLLHGWRMSRALDAVGLDPYGAIAFARCGGMKKRDLLISARPASARPICEFPADGKIGGVVRRKKREYLDRLSRFEIGLSGFDPDDWLIDTDDVDSSSLFCRNVEAFRIVERRS